MFMNYIINLKLFIREVSWRQIVFVTDKNLPDLINYISSKRLTVELVEPKRNTLPKEK